MMIRVNCIRRNRQKINEGDNDNNCKHCKKNYSEDGDYNGNNDSNYNSDVDDLDNNRSYCSDTMNNNRINNGTK